ncbi:MAG: hypothetical protein IJ454_00665 [Clostridia bacterium]|nr:hypothetical protein [Clostridia bacterium]
MLDNLMMRYDGKNFFEIPDGDIMRMEGFKTLSENVSPEEYARKYVDRKSQTVDVVGYNSVMDFEFDRYVGNEVHDDIVDLHEKKVVGTKARRNIYYVDFTQPEGDGFRAVKVPCSVIMSGKGAATEAMTYAGALKGAGEPVFGVAKIATPTNGNPDNVETITFEEADWE